MSKKKRSIPIPPELKRNKLSLIDQALSNAHYRKEAKKEKLRREEREKTHPTVCDCEGGKDWGMSFSQD